MSWASANGTRCRTSQSATSVARENPRGASAASRSGWKCRVADHAGHRRQQHEQLVDRVEERLLVLLQVPVVGQRQALERGQQPGQVADQPAGLAAGELGDVGVLLLRHDAGPGRPGVVERGEAELVGAPRGSRPRSAGTGRPRSGRARTPPRRPGRARRCRRWSSAPSRRSPSSAATSLGSSPSEVPGQRARAVRADRAAGGPGRAAAGGRAAAARRGRAGGGTAAPAGRAAGACGPGIGDAEVRLGLVVQRLDRRRAPRRRASRRWSRR